MLIYDLWSGALFYLPSGDKGRLFYLLRGRREVAALLSRRGALPAADLMKAQGHVAQMANIHQSNNMSDDDGREESTAGRRKDPDAFRYLAWRQKLCC